MTDALTNQTWHLFWKIHVASIRLWMINRGTWLFTRAANYVCNCPQRMYSSFRTCCDRISRNNAKYVEQRSTTLPALSEPCHRTNNAATLLRHRALHKQTPRPRIGRYVSPRNVCNACDEMDTEYAVPCDERRFQYRVASISWNEHAARSDCPSWWARESFIVKLVALARCDRGITWPPPSSLNLRANQNHSLSLRKEL